MDRAARLNSLIERVADAPAPSRELFAEVWFATTGKQHPDIKGRFAVLMDAKAWTEAALITVACALPDWRVVTKASVGPGEALMLPPDPRGIVPEGSSDTVRHAGGTALAILEAMLRVKSEDR
ncbi:hypothetical protein MKK68_24935 [Methylobacterium sp. E-016]|jgi:hypothetical protein|uniref:hypothetical protein n=1 Tax=Methylobacterium sp. E-016 TaxID=2836556 RepID=UPI001FB8C986|nr:hypothetical protein [Methylobacterium sp. E-016]MCJ2078844.1 hypothetical protein [Methylobacterium sp. E-016]